MSLIIASASQAQLANTKIAFSSQRDGNSEIYVMNIDGTNQTRLTNDTSKDGGPSWSPDGTKIAFWSERNANYDIYVMNTDGSNQTRLTNNAAEDSNPSWSPDGTKIAFHSFRDGNFEVYVMNADGTNQVNLTNNPASDQNPSWSPGGTKIVFQSRRDGNYEIYTMNSDGTNQTRLTNNGTDDDIPSWSPDGTKTAFHSFRDGNQEIYVMNIDGTNQTRLTNNSAADIKASWSPDGTKIAFHSLRDGNEEIYTMNSDGTNQTRLTNNSAIDQTPSWSPIPSTPPTAQISLTTVNAGIVTKGSSGTATFTVTNSGGGTLSVSNITSSNPQFTVSPTSFSLTAGLSQTVTVTFRPTVVGWERSTLTITHNASGSPATVTANGIGKVTPPTGSLANTKIAFTSNRDGNPEIYVMNSDGTNQTRLTNNPALDHQTSWSSDGTKIAFTSTRDGNEEIYTMNADGSNQTRLTNKAFDSAPSWSSDGTKIAFYSNRDGNPEIYVMNADGSNQLRLTNHMAKDDFPSWSPDGTKIAFRSERDVSGGEIYVMNADGSNQIRLINNPAPDYDPSWSSDGTKIAFHSRRDVNAEIYVMNADGSNQIRLTNNAADDSGASWLPDDTKIAFTSHRDGNGEIYVMNADGSNQTNLTNNAASDSGPSWSPFLPITIGPPSPTTSTISASPTSVVADGVAESTITITLRDANNNFVSGKSVTIAATGTGNTVTQPTSATNANGQTTAKVKSTKAEAKTITATVTPDNITLTNTVAVTFTPGPVSASASTISVLPTSVSTDSATGATVTITFLDANGNPVNGKTVTIAVTGTGNTITQPAAATNASGQTTATIKSTKAEAKTLTATNTTDNITLTNSATVTFTTGAVSASISTVSVSPTAVLADNTATATITVTLFDAFNNPLSGKSLSLSASGSNNTISPPSATTNSSGQATFTIKSSAAEIKTITATAEGNVILNQQPTVTFTSTIADGSGSATISPNSFPVNSSGNQITLVYTSAGSITNGAISIDIPSGWTPPQGNQGTAGYTTATSTGTIGALSFAGQTITAPVTSLASNQTVTVVYGSGDGISGATAPSTAGSYTFTVKSKVTASGTLTNLFGLPSITVTRAADGSGTAIVSPTSVSTNGTGSLSFSFTASGQMDGGEISVTAPSGWSGIQSPNASSTGSQIGTATVLGQTISVSITKLAEAQTLSLSFTVTAPSAAGTAAFVVKSKGGPSGTLTAIASSPSVTVTLPVAPDGSGSVTASATSLTSGSTATLTLVYTAVGNMNGGAISVTIPSSWPQPQVGNITATSTGTVGTLTFSGSTVTVPITTLSGGQTITVTYSNVVLPAAGTYEFTVKSKGSASGTLISIASSPSVSVTAPVTFAAGDGTGKVSVSPDSLFVKSKENKISFTFTAEGSMNGGAISLTIPSGWSPPQTNPSKAGYVNVTSTGSLGSLTISGQTITIPITTLSANQTIKIEYGGIWEGSGVVAPSIPDGYKFTFKSQASASGGLKDIAQQPAISVIDLPHTFDGSGKVEIVSTSPSTLVAASLGNEIKFRFTSEGLMDSGAISLTVPQGWSLPQGASGQPGYTVASPVSQGASIGILTFSGATVTIPIINLDKDQSLDIIYGSGGGSSGAVTSDLVNSPINFIVMSMGDSLSKGRQLKPVAPQPTVTLSYAPDGSGTLAIESKPSPVIAGNSGYEITFTYTASGLIKDGTFSMTLPEGWTPPQLSGGVSGQLVVSATGSVSQPNVSGQNITISISRLAGGQVIKIIYGIGGSVKAPSNTGINNFQVKSQSTASGNLTLLPNQATLLVSNATDGSGKVTVVSQPPKVTAGSKNNQISFIYTPIGTIVDGELSLEVPVSKGWSPPQLQSNLPGAVSVTSTGTVGIVSLVGNVIKVPIKSLKSDQSLTLQYGSVGASGASAPIVSTNSRFEVKVKGSANGILTPLAESDQPIIKVENAADGSGEVSFSSNPVNIYSGQSGLELTFVYKAVGTMDGGAISLSFPAGWSPPQAELGKAGYTVVTSTGQIGAAEFITSASTLKVPIIKLGSGETITIIYGSGGKESGGKAPSVVGIAPLTLKSQGSASGTLQPVSGQLSVTLKLNSPPIITQIGSQAIVPNQPIIFEVNEGSEISFNTVAKDSDNDPLTYKAENLPKGSSFDSATGKFSWKLGYDLVSVSEGAKDYIIKVSATDGQLSDTKEVTMRVNQVSRAADLTFELSPDKLVADGKSTSKVTVKVLDSESKVVADEVVSLKASLGKITSPATNNNDGSYTAEYASATTTGNAIITATTSNNKSKSATIALTSLDTVAEIQSVEVKGSPAKAEGKISIVLKAEVEGRKAEFSIEGVLRATGVLMKETAPGVYEGEYIAVKGDNVTDAKAKVNFEDKVGNKAEDSSQKVTIDTIPPPAPKELKIAGDTINANNVISVELTGQVTANAPLKASFSDGANTIEKSITADPTGLFKLSFDASALKDGIITISVSEGADLAGNLGEKAQISVIKNTAKTVEKPDFLLSSSSTLQNVEPDKPLIFVITIFGQGGFNLPITLTADGLPEGASGRFNPKVLTPTAEAPKQDSQLTISGLEKIPEGEHSFTLIAITSDGKSKNISLKLKKQKASVFLTILLSSLRVKLGEKLKAQGELLLPAESQSAKEKISITLTFIPPSGKVIEQNLTAEKLKYEGEIATTEIGKWKVIAKWSGDQSYKATEKSDEFEVIKGASQIIWSLTISKSVKLGEKTIISAQLKPPIANQSLQLQFVSPSNIATLDKTSTDDLGTFKYDFTGKTQGSWKIKVTWDGNESHDKASSDELAIAVIKEQSKAIIVLGGGDEFTNPAWNRFAGLANYVYKILKKRAFFDDDIYYLSPTLKPTEAKDAVTAEKNLEFAITNWAAKRVNSNVPLFIYFLSHNLDDKFLLEKSEKGEVFLTPAKLALWLDALPEGTQVTIIIEACNSGGFISKKINGKPVLSKPGRTLIASAKDDRQAAILPNLSSFSKEFFDRVLRNKDIKTAFLGTRESLRALRQHSQQFPQIDADGDGTPNDPIRDFVLVEKKFIPEDIETLPIVPEIVEVSKAQKLAKETKTATIQTKISGANISRVFGVIIPPTYDPSKRVESWDELNFDEISFKLKAEKAEGIYEASYDKFTQIGTYSVVIYAENPDGSAIPVETTVEVPTILSLEKLSPDTVEQGAQNQDILIIGTKFDGKAGEEFGGTVSFSGTKITVNSVKYISSTQLKVNINIASDAAIGSRNVVVINPEGESTKKDGGLKIEAIKPPEKALDVDKDGEINIFDLVLVATGLGQQAPSSPAAPNPDVNGDGEVNIFDLVLIARRFGEKTTPKAAPAYAAYDLASREIISNTLSDVDLLIQIRDLLKAIPNANPGILKAIAELERLIAIANPVVKETKLLPNYPNPFNPETWIPFSLAESSEVTIQIYDIKGELVKTLNLGRQEKGFYFAKDKAAYWDGRNDAGERVASGLYLYRLQAGNFSAIRRMLLLK